jgi:hypothetical protein
MASTYSSLKIELIGTGEQEGIWGNTTNVNLGTAIEQAITGSGDVTFASADVTLTLTNTNASQIARNLRLVCVGVSDGPRQLVVPAIEKQYIVKNELADAVTIRPTAGTGVAIPAGKTMTVFNNGTDIVEVNTYANNFAVGGTFSSTGNLSALNISTANVTATGAGSFTGNVSAGNFSTAGNSNVGGNITVTGNSAVTGNSTVGGFLTVTGAGTFNGTGALKIPVGTTGQQPSPVTGMIRFNSSTNLFEGYGSSAWSQLGAGATGGGGNQVFFENDQLVTLDYTIPSTKNAMTAGPITIDTGVTVTVSTGSTWTVV